MTPSLTTEDRRLLESHARLLERVDPPTRLAEATRKALAELDRLREWIGTCGQCGQLWADRACGPTHAALAHSMRIPGEAQRWRAEAEQQEALVKVKDAMVRALELRVSRLEPVCARRHTYDDGKQTCCPHLSFSSSCERPHWLSRRRLPPCEAKTCGMPGCHRFGKPHDEPEKVLVVSR